MARPVDPMRRALPVAEWPLSDRQTWVAAQTTGDVFDVAGAGGPLGHPDPFHE